jgi:hypothetical protein
MASARFQAAKNSTEASISTFIVFEDPSRECEFLQPVTKQAYRTSVGLLDALRSLAAQESFADFFPEKTDWIIGERYLVYQNLLKKIAHPEVDAKYTGSFVRVDTALGEPVIWKMFDSDAIYPHAIQP